MGMCRCTYLLSLDLWKVFDVHNSNFIVQTYLHLPCMSHLNYANATAVRRSIDSLTCRRPFPGISTNMDKYWTLKSLRNDTKHSEGQWYFGDKHVVKDSEFRYKARLPDKLDGGRQRHGFVRLPWSSCHRFQSRLCLY